MKLNLNQFGYCLPASASMRTSIMDSVAFINHMMMNGLIHFVQEDEPLK